MTDQYNYNQIIWLQPPMLFKYSRCSHPRAQHRAEQQAATWPQLLPLLLASFVKCVQVGGARGDTLFVSLKKEKLPFTIRTT